VRVAADNEHRGDETQRGGAAANHRQAGLGSHLRGVDQPRGGSAGLRGDSVPAAADHVPDEGPVRQAVDDRPQLHHQERGVVSRCWLHFLSLSLREKRPREKYSSESWRKNRPSLGRVSVVRCLWWHRQETKQILQCFIVFVKTYLKKNLFNPAKWEINFSHFRSRNLLTPLFLSLEMGSFSSTLQGIFFTVSFLGERENATSVDQGC